MIQEIVSYEFSNETIRINGESFSSEISWNSILKVEQVRKWILIYQSKMVANIIPKSDLNSNQILELNQIISTHSNIKCKLK